MRFLYTVFVKKVHLIHENNQKRGKSIMLTNRLETVLAHVSGRTVADIGTDHAYIPIELIKRDIAERAVACDINEGPLKSAAANVNKSKLGEKIALRLGSGISRLECGEVQTVIIAGMGGILISDILSADEEKAHSFDELILQPMNAQSELRKYLSAHNFEIVNEDLAVEGFKVYNIMTVRTGKGREYSEYESHIPSELKGHRYFLDLLKKKDREFTKILSGLCKAAERDDELIEYYSELAAKVKEELRATLGDLLAR